MSQLVLSVSFDLVSGVVTYRDETDYAGLGYSTTDVKGLLEITHPDGLKQSYLDLTAPAFTSASLFRFSRGLRTDVDGEIMRGVYKFVITSYEGATLIGTNTYTIDFQYEQPTAVLTESLDVFVPSLKVDDDTDYEVDDFTIKLKTRSLSFEASVGTGSTASPSLSLAVGGVFYASSYVVSLETFVTYEDDWFEFRDKITKTVSFDVTKPIMLTSILSLANCLLAKRNALDCCKDATYELLNEDYQTVISLYSQFVANGQASISTNQSALLAEILSIFQKWGCGDDGTIEDAALSGYDWCLCDGGGGSGAKYRYSAGNGAYVSSSVNNDVTFAKSLGVGTFTAATGDLYGGTVVVTTADAVYTSFGATQSFKLVIPVEDANEDAATLIADSVTVWEAVNLDDIDESSGKFLTKDEGAVQIRIVEITGNTVSIAFANIGSWSSKAVISFIVP